MNQSKTQPTERVNRRLQEAEIIWVASVRPNGAPHLSPVWFVWDAGCFFICISPVSRKARNLAQNPQVAVSLEDGRNVVIAEGVASPATESEREQVAALFLHKYDWDIRMDSTYTLLLKITPRKFLTWGDEA
ncbi:MAG: pyridoxamine 5'-phosphate oxidase family protein [Anaerolineae bacterium]|nr:pyridoxamine 5'-phosphate oxidase family protein [Anaerolineae bacterium]MDW8099913.1 pyridoxamine 5'-phosphate oxidase family protein [Anaerolineae bacterium]